MFTWQIRQFLIFIKSEEKINVYKSKPVWYMLLDAPSPDTIIIMNIRNKFRSNVNRIKLTLVPFSTFIYVFFLFLLQVFICLAAFFWTRINYRKWGNKVKRREVRHTLRVQLTEMLVQIDSGFCPLFFQIWFQFHFLCFYFYFSFWQVSNLKRSSPKYHNELYSPVHNAALRALYI